MNMNNQFMSESDGSMINTKRLNILGAAQILTPSHDFLQNLAQSFAIFRNHYQLLFRKKKKFETSRNFN